MSELVPTTPPFSGRMPAGMSASEARSDVLDYAVGLVRRRWMMVAACGMAAAAVAGAFVSRRPPEYEGVATLRVYMPSRQIPGTDVLLSGNTVTTEIQMLQSRALAAAVAESLGLRLRVVRPVKLVRSRVFARVRVDSDAPDGVYRLVPVAGGNFRIEDRLSGNVLSTVGAGRTAAARGFEITLDSALSESTPIDFDVVPLPPAALAVQGGISAARQTRDADIISVSYRTGDPALAAEVPNVLVRQFMVDRRTTRQAATRSSAQFLRSEISKLSVSLRASEDSLRAFREARGVVSLKEQENSEVRGMADLVARRNSIAAERAALHTLLATVRPAGEQAPTGPSPYRHLVAFPTLLQNGVIGGLLGSLASTEDRLTDLLSRRSTADPDVQVLSSRVRALETQLREVCDTYLQGLTNQVEALDATIRDSRSTMDRLPATELQLGRLERERQGLEQIYTQLQSKLKEAEIAEAADDPTVQLVDAAVAPSAPARTRKRMLVAAGLFLGLMSGLALAALRERFDPAVYTTGDVEAAIARPVLGLIPHIDGGAVRAALAASNGRGSRRLLAAGGRRVAQADAPRGHAVERFVAQGTFDPLADAYDRLHTNIMWANASASIRKILFTSALPGDGKTTSATNFALTLAQRGLRVLLVDGDLRRGSIHKLCGGSLHPGFSDLVEGSSELVDVVRRRSLGEGRTFDYIAAGSPKHNPAQLLGSERARSLVADFADRYDRVIIDSSPLNIVSDAAILGREVDGVIFVARAGVTPFDALSYAADQLSLLKMPVLGSILNDIDFQSAARYDPAYRWYSRGQEYYQSHPDEERVAFEVAAGQAADRI
jgi:succinoglycan biosynthesis transport protein ExoP